MGKFKDLTGKRFCRLTVMDIAYKKQWDNGYTRYMWRCVCDCGKEVITPSTALRTGRTVSCGCKNREFQRNRFLLKEGEAATNAIFYLYKRNAEKAGLEFCFSREQFLHITSKYCYYCGSPPSNTYTQRHSDGTPKLNGSFVYNGIDRKDNTKGYTLKNCVPCCDICNKAKRAMTFDQFIEYIERIIEYWSSDRMFAAGS